MTKSKSTKWILKCGDQVVSRHKSRDLAGAEWARRTTNRARLIADGCSTLAELPPFVVVCPDWEKALR